MDTKAILIAAGLTGVAAVAGVTSAVMQSQNPQPLPTVAPTTIVSPTLKPTDKPGAVPAAKQSAEGAAPQAPVTAPIEPTEPLPSKPQAPEAASRKVETCKITMAKVADANPPLNVRSNPTIAPDNVVGKLKNGTFVTVTNELDGWFAIATPVKGWIAQNQTESDCNEKTERVSFGAGGDSVTIAERFVGTGSHRYRFNLGKGQTLSVRSDRGPLPMILAPNGKELRGLDDRQKSWTGELAMTGDYTLELDSNYKGYKYSFSVQVK
ncbi:peptide-binding protein [Phormidesmis priestleyi ULC007]|uniref:Peptide-binding protein n=1 Tax=Phormidesmis priestleyi ULC007 TaxID=1920490 RepID=A0A2T1D9J4_9CYAN|nr:SH3 domain-containing protein [Phormidesmis priestleyi]PSB17179.1 peptide-binding protein [Phormidesmis priestleyi ULC007]PZO47962.1 MAG: peptide-binding protein [Phormidesmis priestleyi]